MAKLFITDQRMLLLMEWAIQIGIAENQSQYMEMIGFSRTNINNIRNSHQHFTREHILKACELTGASADYVFGLTNLRLRKPPRKGIELLKEAVGAVEQDLKRTRYHTQNGI